MKSDMTEDRLQEIEAECERWLLNTEEYIAPPPFIAELVQAYREERDRRVRLTSELVNADREVEHLRRAVDFARDQIHGEFCSGETHRGPCQPLTDLLGGEPLP